MVARTDSDDEHDVDENHKGNQRQEGAASYETWKDGGMREPKHQQDKTRHQPQTSENEMYTVMGRLGTISKLLLRRLATPYPEPYEPKGSQFC
jgi:hypothetical protein